jgi:hypothetical protein
MFLRCVVYDTPKKWKKWLPQAELWYNTSYHSAIQCSPFKPLYGYDPGPILAPPMEETTNTSVVEWSKEREAYNELLRDRLLSHITR